MGLILNGNAPSKIIYNGVEVSLYFNGSKIWPEGDPYNPLNLPPNTVRVRTRNGNPPNKGTTTSYDTATLVPGTTDVYDVYKSGTSFRSMLVDASNVIEVLGANTNGITNMDYMFYYCDRLASVSLFDTSSVTSMERMFLNCRSLISVPLFDTSNVTTTYYMFGACSSLTSVPLFNTSKVTEMSYMFNECYKVESGALALYQQASTQTTPPTSHSNTFRYCGRDTTQGAAELAQIPTSWGGTMS